MASDGPQIDQSDCDFQFSSLINQMLLLSGGLSLPLDSKEPFMKRMYLKLLRKQTVFARKGCGSTSWRLRVSHRLVRHRHFLIVKFMFMLHV